MKIFSSHNGQKINFVDHENNLIGYDLTQRCCEDASWRIEDSDGNLVDPLPDLEPYVIHRDFYETKSSSSDDDSENEAKFRLVSPHLPNLYIVLSNTHNGFYHHGLTAFVGGKIIEDEI